MSKVRAFDVSHTIANNLLLRHGCWFIIASCALILISSCERKEIMMKIEKKMGARAARSL